jgi:hypothetical protein
VLYDRLELFSGLFLIFALLVGLLTALPRSRRPETDPIVLMTMAMASVLVYAAFSGGALFCSLLYQAKTLPIDVAGTPLYWFATMVAATVLIAWTAGLLIHEMVVLALAARSAARSAMRL